MISKPILIGSTYFFKDFDDFNSKDVDILILIDNPKGFNYIRQSSGTNNCLFEWKRMSAEEFIKYTLKTKIPMSVGKFLVKEFADEISFTIEHLKKLKLVFNKLDAKHKYEKIIFDAYIKNNSYELTEQQLKEAYDSYKLARKDDKENG